MEAKAVFACLNKQSKHAQRVSRGLVHATNLSTLHGIYVAAR